MNCIVTGASRGIGYETVKALSKLTGHQIIAVARTPELLASLNNECRAAGAQSSIHPIAADLGKPESLNQLVKQASLLFSRVDVLINNAGLFLNKPFQDISDSELGRLYEVNVLGVFRLIRELVPLLGSKATANTGAGPSHVVNISSMGGVQGSTKFKGLSAYSSAKGALAVLTECLAEELKTQFITVNCLALGAVQTEMLEKAFPGYKAPLSAAQMGAYIANFALTGQEFFNGKILEVSLSTP